MSDIHRESTYLETDVACDVVVFLQRLTILIVSLAKVTALLIHNTLQTAPNAPAPLEHQHTQQPYPPVSPPNPYQAGPQQQTYLPQPAQPPLLVFTTRPMNIGLLL